MIEDREGTETSGMRVEPVTEVGEVDTVIGTLAWLELVAWEEVPTFVGGEGPRGRSLWQFPNSPGRQQEHLRHLAVPL